MATKIRPEAGAEPVKISLLLPNVVDLSKWQPAEHSRGVAISTKLVVLATKHYYKTTSKGGKELPNGRNAVKWQQKSA